MTECSVEPVVITGGIYNKIQELAKDLDLTFQETAVHLIMDGLKAREEDPKKIIVEDLTRRHEEIRKRYEYARKQHQKLQAASAIRDKKSPEVDTSAANVEEWEQRVMISEQLLLYIKCILGMKE